MINTGTFTPPFVFGLDDNGLDTLPGSAGTPSVGDGFGVLGGYTPKTGPLAGVTLNADDVIVWSGDTGTQYQGWIVLQGPVNSPTNWSVPTTTATPVPDLFTGATTWGEKRQFTVTMPGGVGNGDFYQVLTNFDNKTDLYRITVVEQVMSGSIYEFFLADEGNTGGKSFLGAEIIRNSSTAPPIAKFHSNHNGASGLCLYFELNSYAASQTFTITVEGTDLQSLDSIKLNLKAAAKVNIESTLEVMDDYPTTDLIRRLQIMSGNGSAGLPPGLKPADNADGIELEVGPSGVARYSGYWQFASAVTHDICRCLIKFKRADGSTIPTLATVMQNGHGLEVGGTGYGLNISLLRTASNTTDSLPTSYNAAFYGRDYRFSLEIDNRRPGQTKVFYESWYTQFNDVPSYMWYEFFTANADMVKKILFTGHGGTGVFWNVYID
jgi:hypothetical protein